MVKKLDKKGVLRDLESLAIGLAVVAIVIVVGFLIIAQAGNQAAEIDGNGFAQCNSSACNATRTTQDALQQLPDWLSIVVIVVIGAIILGLIQLFRRR